MTTETTQPLRPLTLWWKKDGRDIELGTGFDENIPPKGTLLAFPCEHGNGWRVTEVQVVLVMKGSMTWAAWRAGRPHETSPIDVFVEPADGPFGATDDAPAAPSQPPRLNKPMVARLRACAADTSSNWDGQITIYPLEARDLVALIDHLNT